MRLKTWIVIAVLCAALIIGALAMWHSYEAEQQRIIKARQEDLQKMTDGFSKLIGGSR